MRANVLLLESEILLAVAVSFGINVVLFMFQVLQHPNIFAFSNQIIESHIALVFPGIKLHFPGTK